MQSLIKSNKGITYLLCAIDFGSKNNHKRWRSRVRRTRQTMKYGLINKIWDDQGGEFYNFNVIFLKINNIEMYLTYNKGKSVVAERFIRALKNKIFKHMTAISKNVYFDALDDIINKYNNTVHRTIKMKPIDVTSDSYAECNEDDSKKA